MFNLGESPTDTPLKAFVSVASQLEGRTSKVEKVDIGKNVRKKIAELEVSLGLQLLVSNGDETALTVSGRRLFEYAYRALPDVEGPSSPSPTSATIRQRRFTTSRSGSSADEVIEHTMNFVTTLAKADSGIFFWVGSDGDMVEPHHKNVDRADIKYYEKDIGEHDPLHVSKLWSEGRHLCSLTHRMAEGIEIPTRYARHLATLGIRDEINLLFWQSQRPIACLALFRQSEARPFNLNEFEWDSLHGYIQSSLMTHWRARSAYVENILVENYALKPRELDVVEWLVQGKSNWEIGQILGIRESTVKVHVASILKKLGMESRLALSCWLNSL